MRRFLFAKVNLIFTNVKQFFIKNKIKFVAMGIEEMLSAIREHYGLQRNADFARALGISPQAANSYAKRQSLDYDLLHEKFPELSPIWLLSKGEEGEMILARQNQTVHGNQNMTAGRDINMHEETQSVLDKMQNALLNEQETCRKLQAQMDGMLEIMKNMTAINRSTGE